MKDKSISQHFKLLNLKRIFVYEKKVLKSSWSHFQKTQELGTKISDIVYTKEIQLADPKTLSDLKMTIEHIWLLDKVC